MPQYGGSAVCMSGNNCDVSDCVAKFGLDP